MALKYHPAQGTILMCDYRSGFIPPEMVKSRPCIVVSPRLRQRNNLCSVVPLSTTPPDPILDHHCQISLDRPLPAPFNSPTMWVKCDMLATVSFDRLDLIQVAKRTYITPRVTADELEMIQLGMLHALGLGLELERLEKRLRAIIGG